MSYYLRKLKNVGGTTKFVKGLKGKIIQNISDLKFRKFYNVLKIMLILLESKCIRVYGKCFKD